MLLGHFRAARQLDVHPTGSDVGDACTEVTHQALAVEAGLYALLDLGARLSVLRLVFHVLSSDGRRGLRTGWTGLGGFTGRPGGSTGWKPPMAIIMAP